MSSKVVTFSTFILFPLAANAYPALLFQGKDFSGRLDFNMEFVANTNNYNNSDILENWDIIYANGIIINPANTISQPGYRKDGKGAILDFGVDSFGLLRYLEFYVTSISGNEFDLQIGRDVAGNLYELQGIADIVLVGNSVPEPGTFTLLVAALSGLFTVRKRNRTIREIFRIFSRRTPNFAS